MYFFLKCPILESNANTITQIPNHAKTDKKGRTHSCSSIPYDDIIDNLAVFRKSFDNVHFFHDESRHLVPIENIAEKKVCIKVPEDLEPGESVRNFATTFVTDIIDSAAKVAKSADSKKTKIKPFSDSASYYESRTKCETSSTVGALYTPIIIHTPSADNLLDAQNFVEEYEEYHDSCSEISTTKLEDLLGDADQASGSWLVRLVTMIEDERSV